MIYEEHYYSLFYININNLNNEIINFIIYYIQFINKYKH